MTWVLLYMASVSALVIFDPLPRWRARRDAMRPIDDIERHQRVMDALEQVTGRKP